MSGMHGVARVMRWTAGGLGLLAVGYATVAGTTWYRYGRVPSPSPDERDPLLDQFMPEYEVAERHHVRVAAPAAMTLSAAADSDLQQSTIVRVIFRARELVLGAKPDAQIVVGAVTQPWLPNVVFRGLAPEEFRAFQEPGYVKIVWTLRADPVGESESMFPHRDARDNDGSDGTHEVSLVLGALLARYRLDSARHARTAEDGR